MSSTDQLRALRDQAAKRAEAVLLERRNAGYETLDPTTDAQYQTHYNDLVALNARIADAEEDERRAGHNNPNLARIRAAQQTPTGSKTMSVHVSEPELYRRGGQFSFGADLVAASVPGMDLHGEARSRLQRHNEDMAERFEYRDISRVDGSGGYAVPPAWLMDQYVELARPGRAFANLCQQLPLPGGTDSINIPKVLTGTTVAVQTADNTGVSETNLTDTFINAPVRTIAGQQGVAIQLIDQSPLQFDQVIFSDLIKAHAGLLDTQVLYGSGSSGQVLGVANTPGVTSIPVSGLTDVRGVYSALANAQQQILTTRYMPAEVIVMAPRRWAWCLTLVDGQQRPLFVPSAGGPMNVGGVLESVDTQQVVGHVQGLPVVTDPNVSLTNGAGSNEDVIYVARTSDLLLWESGIRARVLPETRAANLTVLIQIYSYLAFSAARYPQSVVELTGLTPPSF
jgi:HK97 family phage major capsid protein